MKLTQAQKKAFLKEFSPPGGLLYKLGAMSIKSIESKDGYDYIKYNYRPYHPIIFVLYAFDFICELGKSLLYVTLDAIENALRDSTIKTKRID